jgi:hypothetical protein
LNYCIWVGDNVVWLNDYIRRLEPGLLKPDECASEYFRLVIVAEFDERVRRVVAGVEPEVMFVDYDSHVTPPNHCVELTTHRAEAGR